MKLNSKCMACQIRKQEAKFVILTTKTEKNNIWKQSVSVLNIQRMTTAFPSISTELKKFRMEDFTRINKEYDQLLDLEAELRFHYPLFEEIAISRILCRTTAAISTLRRFGSQQRNCAFSY